MRPRILLFLLLVFLFSFMRVLYAETVDGPVEDEEIIANLDLFLDFELLENFEVMENYEVMTDDFADQADEDDEETVRGE